MNEVGHGGISTSEETHIDKQDIVKATNSKKTHVMGRNAHHNCRFSKVIKNGIGFKFFKKDNFRCAQHRTMESYEKAMNMKDR